ncbi:BhlA/UviB family holin-like peptide [Clostridium sp. Marseille-Q7071]
MFYILRMEEKIGLKQEKLEKDYQDIICKLNIIENAKKM